MNSDHLGSVLIIITALVMFAGLYIGFACETRRRFDEDVNRHRTPGMGDSPSVDEMDTDAAERIRAAVLAEARALARDNARRSGEVTE